MAIEPEIIQRPSRLISNERLLEYLEDAYARVQTMGPRGEPTRRRLIEDYKELRGLVLLRMKEGS